MNCIDTLKKWLGLAAKPAQLPEPISEQPDGDSAPELQVDAAAADAFVTEPEPEHTKIELPNGRIAAVDERGNFKKFVDSSLPIPTSKAAQGSAERQ